MRTDHLIEMLARGAGPAPRVVAARRLVPVAAAGVLFSAAVAMALFGPIPAEMYATTVPWMKLAYTAALALAAGWLAARLARPVARLAGPRAVVVAVWAAMAVLGLVAYVTTPEGERVSALLGHSWWSCPGSVLLLSVPTLAGALWAVGSLAPTRPQAAGFAAGLMAGSAGALGYSLSCPEASAAFVAVWYTLGILATAGAGAWLGPRVLRW